jgi:RimJ/RimL family protein N-acetyltransferase
VATDTMDRMFDLNRDLPHDDAPRVSIVQLPRETLDALADRDVAQARATSPVEISDWLGGADCVDIWRLRSRQTAVVPDDVPWVTGVVRDDVTGRAVGRAGFHAAPDRHGMVELGYATDPEHRRRGYARAALAALVDRARAEPAVRVLRATVSPTNAASLALIHEHPFLEVGEQWDDVDGLEIVYEMPVD